MVPKKLVFFTLNAYLAISTIKDFEISSPHSHTILLQEPIIRYAKKMSFSNFLALYTRKVEMAALIVY